jgi:hypothetical protein
MPRTFHKKPLHFCEKLNYKTKVPPSRAPAMTMTAESSGSCSTAVALLDVVDPEGVLVDEADVAEEEVDTGNCGVSETIQKGKSERRQRPLEHVSF